MKALVLLLVILSTALPVFPQTNSKLLPLRAKEDIVKAPLWQVRDHIDRGDGWAAIGSFGLAKDHYQSALELDPNCEEAQAKLQSLPLHQVEGKQYPSIRQQGATSFPRSYSAPVVPVTTPAFQPSPITAPKNYRPRFYVPQSARDTLMGTAQKHLPPSVECPVCKFLEGVGR